MAATVVLRFSLLYLFIIAIVSSSTHPEEDDILIDLKDMTINPPKQKISHFRMYWHDIVSGQRPTSVSIVKSPTTDGFGLVNMIDNPLTLGPDVGSKLVGRAQGFYALASQNEIGLLMTMNLVLSYGKYNGSTITVLGRNPVMNKEREMPVIGGTGHFRFARGYVRVRTHWFDLKTGDAIAEYNLYVLHY